MAEQFQRRQTQGSIPNFRGAESSQIGGLAQSLESFAQWGLNRYAEARVASAREEALAQEPSRTPPALRDQATMTGKAYNDVMLAGHAAAIKNDYTQRINDLAAENQSDPVGFETKAKAYRAELINSVDETMRMQVAADFDAATIRPLSAIKLQHEATTTAEAVLSITGAANTYMDDAAIAARAGDLVTLKHNQDQIYSVVDQLNEAGMTKQAQALMGEFESRMDEQLILGEAQRAIEAGNGAQFLQELISNPPEGLTPEAADGYAKTINVMNNRWNNLQKQQEVGMSIERQREISNLEIAINTGSGDPEALMTRIERAHSSGEITPAKRTELFTKIINRQEEQQKELDDYSSIVNRMNGDNAQVVDPKLQDKFYAEHVLPGIANLPMEQQAAANTEYVQAMKRVPKALKDQLNTFMLSGDPALIQQAATMIDRVDQIPGLVDSVFPAEQQAFVETVVELSRNLEPDKAVELAKQMTDPSNAARVDARTKYIRDKKLSDKYGDKAADAMPGWFSSVTEISKDRISREYGQLFESYFKAGMSEDRAAEKASQVISRNWGEWKGNTMKFPPSTFYGVQWDTEADYVLNQAAAEINSSGLYGEKVSPKDVVFIDTEATQRLASKGTPAYVLGVKRDGGLEVVAPKLWYPDVQAEVNRHRDKNRAAMEEEEKKARRFQLEGMGAL